MVVFLADSSGKPAHRIVFSLQNWSFLLVKLIQVLHHQFRGGVKAFYNLTKPDDVILERSLMQSKFLVMVYGTFVNFFGHLATGWS